MWEETIPGRCTVCSGGAANETEIAVRRDGLPVRRCSSCGTLFVDPRPSELSLHNFYTHERNIQMGPGYTERLSNEIAYGNYKCICALPTPAAGQRKLLDVGCAAGFAMHAAQMKGWEVFGAELSPDLAELGRKRLGLTIVTGTQNEIDAMLREAGEFDAIMMLDVIEHVEDVGAFLKAYAKHLKSDGLILIDTPNIPRRIAKHTEDLERVSEIHFQEVLEHLSYLSIDSLRWLCPRLGLYIESWGTYGVRWADYQPRTRARRSARLLLETIPLFSAVYWRAKRSRLAEGEVLYFNDEEHAHLFAVLRRTTDEIV